MDEIILEDEETGLLVSNLGRVWGKFGQQKCCKDRSGYQQASYYKNGKLKLISVHRLVARNFIPNPSNLPQVNHINENKTDNQVYNLEWCTQKYNVTYGTVKKRQLESYIANGNAKRISLQKGDEVRSFDTLAEAARELGVIQTTLGNILNRKRNCHSANGWHLIGDHARISHKKKTTFEKDGVVQTFNSLCEAAKALNLPLSHVTEVVNRKRLSVKGWHLPGVTPKKNNQSRRQSAMFSSPE